MRLVAIAALFLSAGCASNISYWTTPSLGKTSVASVSDPYALRCIKKVEKAKPEKIDADLREPDESDVVELDRVNLLPETDRGDVDTVSALAHAALLMEISYCATEEDSVTKKRKDAALDYRDLGYDAAYFHPRYYLILHDPNLFLLGRPGSNEVTVVFTGTEVGFNPFDLIQDLRTGVSYKGRKDGKPYVPRGHGGFRSSFRNVIRKDFFDDAYSIAELADHCAEQEFKQPDVAFDNGPRVSLANFICRNKIRSGDANEKIKVTVIGHSLGAGIAQMSLGAFEGLTWRREDGLPPQINPPADDWPFEVKTAYLFAPPLALYARDAESCEEFKDQNPIKTYASYALGEDRVYTIIRDGDMVPAIWNPLKRSFHCVEGEHFGTYVRIPRGAGIAFIEKDVDWTNAEPHRPRNYRDAIDKALGALQKDADKSEDATPSVFELNY